MTRPFLLLALCGGVVACTGSDDPSGGSGDAGTGTGTETGATGTGGEPDIWEPILEVGPEVGAFMSVWGPGPDQVYVVGGQPPVDGSPSYGVVRVYDGAAWAEQVVPPGTAMLNWVHGVADEIWAVGVGGTAIVQRGDGGDAWEAVPTGTTETLWGIWGLTTDDLWAVGGDGLSGPNVLLHWDGSAFSPEDTSFLDGTDSSGLFKVWGSAADDVLVVGDRAALLRGGAAGWESIPGQGAGDLIALWGTGADEILVVGGRSSARLMRWDGMVWTEAMPAFPGLNGVWMNAAGNATLVGNNGTLLEVPAGSMEPERETVPTGDVLHAVYGFEGGPRFAVGGTLLGLPPFTGIVLRNGAP